MKIVVSFFLLILLVIIGCNNKPEVEPSNNQLAVYPNPVTDFVNITVPNSNQNNFVLQVFDTYGKIILNEKESQEISRYTLDLSTEPKGTYHVILTIGDFTITQEFIKI